MHSAPAWNARALIRTRDASPGIPLGDKNEIYYEKSGYPCGYGRGGDLFNSSKFGANSENGTEIGKGDAAPCSFAIFRQAAAPECKNWSLGEHANNQEGGRVANPG